MQIYIKQMMNTKTNTSIFKNIHQYSAISTLYILYIGIYVFIPTTYMHQFNLFLQ